jgi:hypothetical protein
MDYGEVVKGDYKGYIVNIDIMGKKVWIRPGFAIKKSSRIYLDEDSVKKYEVLSEGNPDASGSFVKSYIWGTASAINSAKAKVKLLVSVEWKDGKKSLIQCNKKVFQAIQVACYE